MYTCTSCLSVSKLQQLELFRKVTVVSIGSGDAGWGISFMAVSKSAAKFLTTPFTSQTSVTLLSRFSSGLLTGVDLALVDTTPSPRATGLPPACAFGGGTGAGLALASTAGTGVGARAGVATGLP